MQSPHISIRIPPKLNERLESYIKDNGVSKTEAIVTAIARYLNCESEVPVIQRIVELEQRMANLETFVNYNH